MKYINLFIPQFLQKIDSNLMLHSPHIWRTRVHFVAFYALLAWILLFLIGFFYPLSMYDISRTPYAVEDIKRVSFLFLLICGFFSMVYWWQQVVKFRILSANWYHSFMECILFFIGIFMLWQTVNAFKNGIDTNIAYRVGNKISQSDREKLNASNYYLPGFIDYNCNDHLRNGKYTIVNTDSISDEYFAEAEKLTQYLHARIHKQGVELDSQFLIRKELKLSERLDDEFFYSTGDYRFGNYSYYYRGWSDSINAKAIKYIKPILKFEETWNNEYRNLKKRKVLVPFTSDDTWVLDSVYRLFSAYDKYQVDSIKNEQVNNAVDNMRKNQNFQLIGLISSFKRHDFKNVLDTCSNLFFNNQQYTYLDFLKEESRKFELYFKKKQLFSTFYKNDSVLYKNYLTEIMTIMPVYNRISNRAMEVGLYYRRDSLTHSFLNQLNPRSRKIYEELMAFYMNNYIKKEVASTRAGDFKWNKTTNKYSEVEKYMSKGFVDTVFYYCDSIFTSKEKKTFEFDKMLNVLNIGNISNIYREIEDWRESKDTFLIFENCKWEGYKEKCIIYAKMRRDSIPMDTVFKWKLENYSRYRPYNLEKELNDGYIKFYENFRDRQINEQDSAFLDKIYTQSGYIRDSSEHSRLFFHSNAYYLFLADMGINKSKAFLQGWNPFYLSTNYKLAIIILSLLMFFTTLAHSNLFTAAFVAFFINFVNNTFFNLGQSFQEVDRSKQSFWIFALLAVLAALTIFNILFRKFKMPLIYLLINIQLFVLLGAFIWLFDAQTIEIQSNYAYLSLLFWALIVFKFRDYLALPSKK